MVIGVVAEGGTDVAVIKKYLSAWLNRQGEPIDLKVKAVQPRIDATSGRYENGGWTFVKAWCENHPARVRAQLLFEPIFKGAQSIDCLIVQLDADALQEYAQSHRDIVVPPDADARARSAIVKQIQERWLWGSTTRRNKDPNEGRHCLVVSVRALETWLVAGLDPGLADPEELEEPERELKRLKPGLETKVVRGVDRLKKDVIKWEKLADETSSQLAHIGTVCPHCGELLAYVDAAIRERR